MNKIFLKPGKDKAVLRHHPWIFSGAINSVEGIPENGSSVEVFGSDNTFLGIGAYSQYSQIRVRMWTFEKEEMNIFSNQTETICSKNVSGFCLAINSC